MPTSRSPVSNAHSERPNASEPKAVRLPVPVPLLYQLMRPIATMEDVESLAAQLDSARSRGCL
jgi:hypothetical protein